MEQSSEAKGSESARKISVLLGYARKLSWFISACVALLLFFLVRKLLFDVVRVNNHDMEDTYHYGDALLVKKRFNTYTRGDVVLISYPVDDGNKNTRFFQRIAGLPGDSLLLQGKNVLVNNKPLPDEPTVKHNYIVSAVAPRLDSMFMLSYKLTEGGPIGDEHDYSFSLTQDQAEKLGQTAQIKNIELKQEKADSYDEACFPGYTCYRWNRDCYGKIYIPKHNDTLVIDTLNINLYAAIIEDYENNKLEIRQDSIFINSALTYTYVVKQNYYFTLGDNRDNANDSRIWGYLPENKILGKVTRRIKKSRK
jgi:signal peptidase I